MVSGLAATGAACGERAAEREVPVVNIRLQRCARPQTVRGLGVVVAHGLVATAAHTVEGELRALEVDGQPARVVGLDARADLALLAADTAAEPIEPASGSPPTRAVLHTPTGTRAVEIVRTGPLLVHDTTERRRHRREVHTFQPGVEPGTSGAPLTTEDGMLLGIVVLDRDGSDRADAVTAGELTRLMDERRGPPTRPGCDD